MNVGGIPRPASEYRNGRGIRLQLDYTRWFPGLFIGLPCLHTKADPERVPGGEGYNQNLSTNLP